MDYSMEMSNNSTDESASIMTVSDPQDYKKNRYITLSKTDSLNYYTDDEFRSSVLSTIINPYYQLSLDLSYCDIVVDVSNLNNLNSLNLSGCKKIIDFTPLTNIQNLNLSDTNVRFTDNFENINTLILNRCINISDVSKLGSVKKLSLEHCHNLSDVSALGNVEELSLLNCHGLYDVSSLINNHILILKRCHNVSDFTNISKSKVLHTLDISYCNINDINIFKNIPELISIGIASY